MGNSIKDGWVENVNALVYNIEFKDSVYRDISKEKYNEYIEKIRNELLKDSTTGTAEFRFTTELELYNELCDEYSIKEAIYSRFVSRFHDRFSDVLEDIKGVCFDYKTIKIKINLEINLDDI